jgi:hypothetical protein
MPMKKISTLIFLVNKIRSEVTNSSFMGCSDNESYMNDKEDDFSPPDCAVNAILNFARSLEVSKSKTIGNIEWVLN